jgi:uncharacterized protein YdeI (BOF family)
MNSSKRLFAFVFLTGFFVVLYAGCAERPGTKNAGSGASTSPAKKVSNTSATPEIPSKVKADFPPMSAADFIKEAKADVDAATKKYKDKGLVIEGTIVEKIGGPDTKATFLILAGDLGDEPVHVRAGLAIIDGYTVEQFMKLMPGDKVKVNGELLNDVRIYKPEGSKTAIVDLAYGKIVP